MPTKSVKPVPVEDMNSRYFKVQDMSLENGEFFGRFTGKTPKQAAMKAFTSILKARMAKKMAAKGQISFTLQETTRGTHNKPHFYVGERAELKVPVEVTIAGGKTIVYKFGNKVMVDKSIDKSLVKSPKKAAAKKAVKPRSASRSRSPAKAGSKSPKSKVVAGSKAKPSPKKAASKTKSASKTPTRSASKSPARKAASASKSPKRSASRTPSRKAAKSPKRTASKK